VRQFECAAIRVGHRIERCGQFHRGDSQVRCGDSDAVELAREFDEGAISATAYGIDDSDDVAIDGTATIAAAP
jgi:hypothetical protein